MSSDAEFFARALKCHESGDLPQAEQLYREVLQINPHHTDALHLWGVIAYSAGRPDLAVASIRQALDLDPWQAIFYSNMGLAQNALGQTEEAMASFRQAIHLDPNFGDAHNHLATFLHQQGQLVEAVKHAQRAVEIRPTHAEAHNNLGRSLYGAGSVDEAELHFRRALELKPNFSQAHNNLGVVLAERNYLDEAIAHYREALRLSPNYAEAYNNLGSVLGLQHKFDEAITSFQNAIKVNPSFAEAYANLGAVLILTSRLDEAVAACRQAISLYPGYTAAHNNLGGALLDQGKFDEAIAACRQVVTLDPRQADAHNNLGGALLDQGNFEEAVIAFRNALAINPGFLAARTNLLFCMNYDPTVDPDQVFAEHRQWGQLFQALADRELAAQGGLPHPSLESVRDASGENIPLRIGYVSPDFRQHALIQYFEPVLINHDPRNVQIFCYAEVSRPDAITARFKEHAHHWRSIRGLSALQAAKQIREDRIDILVDLAGHTAANRLDIFALKPAPVQATWLGYLNTTGLITVDYRLTDEVLDPPDQPQRDTEELLRLPHGFCCFQPRADAPEVGPLPALKRGHLTFGSLHTLFKLNAAVYDLWSRVLRMLPTARLLMYRDTLQGTVLQRVVREFAQRGIPSERLELKSGPKNANHLHVYADIDVSLDALPWTGGVTTCESLWMGVPMLTLAGVRPAGRNSASILAQVGLNDFVCATPEEYVARAVRLPEELDQLAQLRSTLRERMNKTLCDAKRFTRDLEEAYRTMWHRRSAVRG